MIGNSARKATHYVVKVKIGGIAGVERALIGKQPPDSHVWILQGDAPAFVESEGPWPPTARSGGSSFQPHLVRTDKAKAEPALRSGLQPPPTIAAARSAAFCQRGRRRQAEGGRRGFR